MFYLQIEHHIEFGNVHRFWKVGLNRAEQIVVRFIYRRDHKCLLENVLCLKGKPFGMNDKFPVKSEARRKNLYPVMKQAKRKGNQVSLLRDKLFIYGEQFVFTEQTDTSIDDQHRMHPNEWFRDTMMTSTIITVDLTDVKDLGQAQVVNKLTDINATESITKI